MCNPWDSEDKAQVKDVLDGSSQGLFLRPVVRNWFQRDSDHRGRQWLVTKWHNPTLPCKYLLPLQVFIALLSHFLSTWPFLRLLKLPEKLIMRQPHQPTPRPKPALWGKAHPTPPQGVRSNNTELWTCLQQLAVDSSPPKHDEDILCQQQGWWQLPRRGWFPFGCQQSRASW